MKQNNVMVYDTFMWNWLKFSFCDDVIFIASCINYAFVWNLKANAKGEDCLGYATTRPIVLYWAHEWHFDQDPKTME
jgi:hypothetical protein